MIRNLFQNLTFLRVVTVMTSLLFIPAFMLGVAYFFDQSLQKIIIKTIWLRIPICISDGESEG